MDKTLNMLLLNKSLNFEGYQMHKSTHIEAEQTAKSPKTPNNSPAQMFFASRPKSKRISFGGVEVYEEIDLLNEEEDKPPMRVDTPRPLANMTAHELEKIQVQQLFQETRKTLTKLKLTRS
jgi:hypothetical protein